MAPERPVLPDLHPISEGAEIAGKALLRRAFEPSKGTANSSLIGRKSQSEDDHGRPLFVLRDG
jgi:hypothetical protein